MRAGELYAGNDPELNRELDARQVMVEALNAIRRIPTSPL